MNEEWRDVKGYEGHYRISDAGRLVSLKMGTIKFKKLSVKSNGYISTPLCLDGKTKQKRLHILVARAFIENPFDKSEINHKNGIKSDNRVDNLEWMTHAENMKHASINNMLRYGENHPDSKLVDKDVKKIREMYKAGGETYRSLAIRFGVCYKTIAHIIHRRKWKHI